MKIYYVVEDAGDGTVYVQFYKDKEAFRLAEELWELEAEQGLNSFAEFCGGEITADDFLTKESVQTLINDMKGFGHHA